MPNNKSTEKRLRQDVKRNLRNRMKKSEIRTMTKSVLAAIEAGGSDKAVQMAKEIQSKLDRAAKSGTMHLNTVGRRKAVIHRHLAKLNGTA